MGTTRTHAHALTRRSQIVQAFQACTPKLSRNLEPLEEAFLVRLRADLGLHESPSSFGEAGQAPRAAAPARKPGHAREIQLLFIEFEEVVSRGPEQQGLFLPWWC